MRRLGKQPSATKIEGRLLQNCGPCSLCSQLVGHINFLQPRQTRHHLFVLEHHLLLASGQRLQPLGLAMQSVGVDASASNASTCVARASCPAVKTSCLSSVDYSGELMGSRRVLVAAFSCRICAKSCIILFIIALMSDRSAAEAMEGGSDTKLLWA